MGYYLHAFIGSHETLLRVQEKYSTAYIHSLWQHISMIPLTEVLFEQINNGAAHEDVGTFVYLTANIEKEILAFTSGDAIAYVEAEYSGGLGEQQGITWKDGIRINKFPPGKNAINAVLKSFGIIAGKGLDEFDTAGLGHHRHTSDWQDQ